MDYINTNKTKKAHPYFSGLDAMKISALISKATTTLNVVLANLAVILRREANHDHGVGNRGGKENEGNITTRSSKLPSAACFRPIQQNMVRLSALWPEPASWMR